MKTKTYPTKTELAERMHACSVQVFMVDAQQAKENRATVANHPHYDGELATHTGWYFWTCSPGCLPDSAPFGPYGSPLKALRAAYDAEFITMEKEEV